MTVKNYRILTASMGVVLIALFFLQANLNIYVSGTVIWIVRILLRFALYFYAMGYMETINRSPIWSLLVFVSPGFGLVGISLFKPKNDRGKDNRSGEVLGADDN